MNKLMDLVDGRDFFQQEGEVIRKAILIHSGKHVYVSSIKNKRNEDLLMTFTMRPNYPMERDSSWVPSDQLKFYV